MLSRKKKKEAERIARYNFDAAARSGGGGLGSKPDRLAAHKDLAEKWTKEDIESLRDGFGQQYGSVLSSILISLMLRFAMKLIEKWINKKIDELLGD
jgi:hypothetical protein